MSSDVAVIELQFMCHPFGLLTLGSTALKVEVSARLVVPRAPSSCSFKLHGNSLK